VEALYKRLQPILYKITLLNYFMNIT